MTDKESKDQCVTANVLNCDLYKNADTILIYVSSEIEVDTFGIMKDAFFHNKTVATPLCNPTNCTMEFYVVEKFDDLQQG